MTTTGRGSGARQMWAVGLVVVAAVGLAVAALLLSAPQRRSIPLAEVSAVIALAAAILACREFLSVARERRAAEMTLRDSERKFARILAIAVDAIITTDARQNIVHFNRGAENIFGWTEAEVLGKPLGLLLPPVFRERHGEHMRAFRRSGETARHMGSRGSISGLRKSGEEFPADASISHLEVGGESFYTVLLRDVTEQTREQRDERFLARATATLSVSLEYSATLVSVVHLAVPHLADCCILDVLSEDGSIARVASVHDDPDHTRRLRELEQPRMAITGTAPFPVAHALDTRQVQQVDAPAAGWGSEGTGAALAALGVRSLLTVPLSARDRPVGALTLLSTDPHRSWDQRAQALAVRLAGQAAFAIDNARLYQTAQRATRARDEILGVVSHDLRNPLSAIAMCARVLHDAPPDDVTAHREIVGAILESAGLMTGLIQDLLDVSMIEAGHLRVNPAMVHVDAVVQRARAMHEAAAAERNIELAVTGGTRDAVVVADEPRVLQVLSNLVANAIKFTESGGRITIDTALADGAATIRVQDSGVGIPAEHLPHIFDRYWHAHRQARTTGTGLGLAIARGIVEAHGGRISVTSRQGHGSTFTFNLPLAAHAATEAVPLDRVSSG